MPPRWKRFLCWALGHVPRFETGAEPVTVFLVCTRCGKHGRMVDLDLRQWGFTR